MRKSKGKPRKLLKLSDATINDIEVGDICWVNYPYEEDSQKDINGDSTWGKPRPALVVNKNIHEERPIFVIKGTTSSNDKYNPSDVIRYIGKKTRINCNSIAMLKSHHFLGLIQHIDFYNPKFQDIINTAYKLDKKGKLKFSTYEDYNMMNNNKSYIDILNESNSKSIMKSNCRWDEIYAIYNTLAPHERLFLGNRFIDSPNTVFRWIIQCNGENAGYMELYDMKKSGSHKNEVVVSTAICPQYRGIGILEELEREAENFVYNSSKYNKLIWYAKDDNKRSFKCAERLGYTKRFHELDHWVFDKTIEHKKLLDESNDGKVPLIMSEKDMYCNMSKFHKYGKVFVTGLSGAGKTTIVKDLSKKYDVTVVNLDICHCKLLSICYKPNRSIEELKDNKFGYEFAKSKFGKRVIDMTKKYTKEQCWEPKYVAEIVKNVLDYIDTLSGNFVIEGCQLVFIDLVDKKYIDYPWVFKGTSALKAVCRRTFRDGVKYIPVTIQYIDQWIDQQNHIRELVISNSNDIYTKKEEEMETSLHEDFNDTLSVYNQLSDDEKKLLSPRGKFIDSPNLIYRYNHLVNGKSVGFIEVYKLNGNSNSTGFITLAIVPKYRSKGISYILIKKAIDGCKSKGYSKLIYRIDNSNIASKNVAEKNGFILNRQGKSYSEYYLLIK